MGGRSREGVHLRPTSPELPKTITETSEEASQLRVGRTRPSGGDVATGAAIAGLLVQSEGWPDIIDERPAQQAPYPEHAK